MNKTKIKNFAIGAREKLIADITYKAGMLGITDSEIAEELPQSTADLKFFDVGTKEYAEVSGNAIKQRDALVKAIREKEKDCGKYKEAFEFVVEEVAYTWFNRLVAIRFMEVNDYLPSGIRVLSSANKAKVEPDFVTTPFDTDLEFTPFEQDHIIELKDKNKLDELFRMLFIKQCNKLHEILPELFEKTDDYTELLLTISFTDKDGVVYQLTHDVDEEDFDIEHLDENGKPNGQVEVIGWMYQYYISEKHEQIIDPLHGKTIKKEDIPAATQLFTTDWVVRYMVDNSLGSYWIERNPESNLAEKLEFFVKPKDGHINYVNEKVEPTELTFFDPCMGSGHILVYAFDVLMEIYRECGYTDRDAAKSIVENNLYGLDIDKRAYQLAYFAVMMKARSYNRRILSRGVTSNLTYIEESNTIDRFTCGSLTTDKNQNQIGEYLIDVYKHAQEYGSLQSVATKDYESFIEYLDSLDNGELDIFASAWLNTVSPLMYQLVKQAKIMSNRYAVVCTNPPYFNKFTGHLKDFINTNYKDYAGDLFSVFMFRNFAYCKANGYSAFMTPNVWMSIKSYEALRKFIMSEKSIVGLVQMAHGAFNEVACVDVCAFVMRNKKESLDGVYIKLSEFKGGMDIQGEKCHYAIHNECDYKYYTKDTDIMDVPGSPITAFSATSRMLHLFKQATLLEAVADPKQGIATSDNNRFLRQWFEVNNNSLYLDCPSHEKSEVSDARWYPYNKGGNFRKWYGNNDYVVDWKYDGCNLKQFKGAVLRNPNYYFKESISWSLISSYTIAFRYKPCGHLFDVAGMSCFANGKVDIKYLLALCNSCLIGKIMMMLAPTINYQVGNIAKIPVIVDANRETEIINITDTNIALAKNDWDDYETSWDFKSSPLLREVRPSSLESCYDSYKNRVNTNFAQMQENEEYLNGVFLDIYDLVGDVLPDVSRRDISHTYIYDSKEEITDDIRESYYVYTKQDTIKDFISYAVGCMLGRYSLDVDGLAYAGGEWDDSKYATVIPDADNCIPITDEEYFEDDIVGRFVKFVEMVYGKDTLEENLNFIADALGNKGKTSREVIRNYFLNDFIKDHIKKYQKRPIYWLFDSGKQNGFKALVYMHRWNEDTVGHLRVEYLHKMQRVYEKEIERMQEIIDNSKDNKEISAANKRKEKLRKQLKETKDYDAKIAHIALSRIDIDLDDGVKVNYDKVQTVDGKNMKILAKI